MYALTLWQPWSSLVVLDAKPYEFRHWDYRTRYPKLEGQRIVIHAAARPIKTDEVLEILYRIEEGTSALREEIARPLLERILAAHGKGVVELSAGLGTAILGKPRRTSALFTGQISERDIDPNVWAWPLTDIEKWDEPIPRRGHQGFWHFS